MSINLTSTTFYNLFKDSELLNGMSKIASRLILDNLEEMSFGVVEEDSLRSHFALATEYSTDDFVDAYDYFIVDPHDDSYDSAVDIAQVLENNKIVLCDGVSTWVVIDKSDD